MLRWRTTLLLSILPIGLVLVLALSDHEAAAPPPRPHLPSRAEIAKAQAFFAKVEAVCYRRWREIRAMPKARRPDQMRGVLLQLIRIDARAIARLDALKPPPRAAKRFRRALRVLKGRHAGLERIVTQFDPARVATMSRAELMRELCERAARAERIRDRLDELAEPMGLHKCKK
jgi:hypothetical protein